MSEVVVIRVSVPALRICRYVATNLKSLMKGMQAHGQIEEDDLDDAVHKLSLLIY